jgi:anti-anti-sigma regulatory factor
MKKHAETSVFELFDALITSGARALVTAAREHGSRTVSSVSPEAARTFALLGLDDVLTAAVTKSASARS